MVLIDVHDAGAGYQGHPCSCGEEVLGLAAVPVVLVGYDVGLNGSVPGSGFGDDGPGPLADNVHSVEAVGELRCGGPAVVLGLLVPKHQHIRVEDLIEHRITGVVHVPEVLSPELVVYGGVVQGLLVGDLGHHHEVIVDLLRYLYPYRIAALNGVVLRCTVEVSTGIVNHVHITEVVVAVVDALCVLNQNSLVPVGIGEYGPGEVGNGEGEFVEVLLSLMRKKQGPVSVLVLLGEDTQLPGEMVLKPARADFNRLLGLACEFDLGVDPELLLEEVYHHRVNTGLAGNDEGAFNRFQFLVLGRRFEGWNGSGNRSTGNGIP